MLCMANIYRGKKKPLYNLSVIRLLVVYNYIILLYTPTVHHCE